MTFSITMKNAIVSIAALDTVVLSVIMLSVTNTPILLSIVAPLDAPYK